MATYTTRRSLLFTATTLATLVLSCGVAAQADDAASLLAKHRHYVGWQLGDGTARTLTYTTTVSRGKTKLYRIKRTDVGLIYRSTLIDLRRGNTRDDDGFTGSILWATNKNGFIHPVYGDAAKYTMARDMLFSEGTTLLPGTDRGTATVDGKTVKIVRVTMKGGDAIDLYIDPQTGAYVQAVVDPDGTYETTFHIRSYATIAPGKRYIGSYDFGDRSTRYVDAKFAVNTAVSNDALHPPAPTATWNFANPKPFKFDVTDERFYVTAKVNGVKGHFILDTGASEILLTTSFAARAGVKDVATSHAYGVGGGIKTRIVKIATLQIGGNTLSNVLASSADIHLDRKAPDGLLGYDVMGGAIVRLNTSAGTMQIEDPSTDLGTFKGLPVTVDLSGNTPSVPMKIDNKIAVDATLDTGNFFYVMMSPELRSRYGLAMLVDQSVAGILQSHPVMGGVGGYEVGACGHIDSLSLGPIDYTNGPACFSSSFGGRNVLVGFDYLKHFNYIFDYPHGRIIMQPHQRQ